MDKKDLSYASAISTIQAKIAKIMNIYVKKWLQDIFRYVMQRKFIMRLVDKARASSCHRKARLTVVRQDDASSDEPVRWNNASSGASQNFQQVWLIELAAREPSRTSSSFVTASVM